MVFSMLVIISAIAAFMSGVCIGLVIRDEVSARQRHQALLWADEEIPFS